MTSLGVDDAAYLDYRVRWRAGDQRPGKHAARQAGAGGNFRGYRPFWQLPDARHIDVRRSIVDPFGDVIVRQMEQSSAIVLVIAADVSRSMAGRSDGSGLATGLKSVAALAQAAARSALRAGDAFGFLAFDERIRDDLSYPPSRRRAVGRDLPAALAGLAPAGRSAAGILDLATRLPSRRCLLILASDFLMPLDLLERGLASLARHDVAPIVLGEAGERHLPRAGLLRIRDVETNGTRLMLMRPALHRRWREAEAARRNRLHDLFARHGRPPFLARGMIDIAAVSQHLSAA